MKEIDWMPYFYLYKIYFHEINYYKLDIVHDLSLLRFRNPLYISICSTFQFRMSTFTIFTCG